MKKITSISGNIVDVLNKRIYTGTLTISHGKIANITEDKKSYDTYILPGFIDAHVHVESSMLPPSEFARLATIHGTVATVSDPHEIANVLGIPGVDYMIENGKTVPFKFYFGAPSCVPATSFETAGAIIDSKQIDTLLKRKEIIYLSEMMNFPGVIHGDLEVMAKIASAKKYRKVVDGHAPGLRGQDLKKYVSAGISTDHESFQLDEAREKLSLGMKILIREGSAAKNYESLHPILKDAWENTMFCSDDKHPNDLIVGHINQLVQRSLNHGYDLMHILQCACVNPVKHYGLKVGLLQEGDSADFIVVDNVDDFTVLETYINGQLVSKGGKSLFPHQTVLTPNNFNCKQKSIKDFDIAAQDDSIIRVIEALDGQLITNELHESLNGENGSVVSDETKDILKIVVVNRYNEAPPAIGFIKNFGLKSGAIASTVAHDSHNIVAVGINDVEICNAVNALIENKGGIAAVDGADKDIMSLPIAGLMSDKNGYTVAQEYERLDAKAKEFGSNLRAPFMTLSFMALPVIPKLKMTDKGLFDVEKFGYTELITSKE